MGCWSYRRLFEAAHRTRQIVYFLDPVFFLGERHTQKENYDRNFGQARMFSRTYKFLSLMMDHIFLTTSGRGIESTPIISESSALSLTVLLAFGLGVPSPFLAGGPRFLLVAFFQSSSESSGSELSIRFLRPGAPRPPRAPFFLPGDFFPGLYSSSLPPSCPSNPNIFIQIRNKEETKQSSTYAAVGTVCIKLFEFTVGILLGHYFGFWGIILHKKANVMKKK